jgi:hypothetical protein
VREPPDDLVVGSDVGQRQTIAAATRVDVYKPDRTPTRYPQHPPSVAIRA